MFDGSLKLPTELRSGSIEGNLSLHHGPFLALDLSASGFSWFAELRPS